MKKSNSQPNNHRAFAEAKGFALVATILLMVLLAIITVGTLSLSVVSLRSSSLHSADAEAKANARMALIIAIGELQKEMGPDMRISAKAGILDQTPTTEVIDGVANPHYLGVWNSWNTWLTDKKGALTIQDTYKPGRDPSLFRRWLVSRPNSTKYEMAIKDTPTADMVVVCGAGSAGTDPANHVMASRIPVKDDDRVTGNYAWWVSDESQKVRLDLKPRDEVSTIDKAQIVASQTGRMGIEKMTDMSDFDTNPASLTKMISVGQASISAAAASEHIHDLTAYSMGLLTDVRSGGFRRDLNLAFESETVPSEMDQATLYGTRPFDAPIRPMTGVLASVTPQNPYIGPMSWRQMREYYRLYRDGFADSAMMRPVAWSGGKPTAKRLLIGKEGYIDDWDTKGYARQLVMLRQTWIIATSTSVNATLPGGLDHFILAIPVITLWNPYNVSMQVDPREISHLGQISGAMNLQQKVYRGGVLVSDTVFPDDTATTWGTTSISNPANPNYNPKWRYWAAEGNRRPNGVMLSNQVGFRMIITDNPSAPSPIAFGPGEVRVFSTDTRIMDGGTLYGTLNNRFFYSSAGYTPINNTNSGVLRGLRYRVYPGTGLGTLSCSLSFNNLTLTRNSTSTEFGASRKSGIVWNFQEVFDNNGDAVRENGNIVDVSYIRNITLGRRETFWDNTWHGATCLDWLTTPELSQSWIVRDEPANQGQWPAAGSPPLPIGIVSIVAKSPERLVYDQSTGFGADYRNRSWLHSPATRLSNFLMNPVDLNRADSPYQLHFRPVNGDQGVSEFLQADGVNSYFGGGYTPSKGQTHVTALNIPAAPIMNLASFAGIRMDRGRTREIMPRPGNLKYTKVKYTSPSAGSFGAGIGNGYAHPMITANTVYTRNAFGLDNSTGGSTNLNITDDYWDHLFLANEELWDSWFCSGIAPVVSNGSVVTPKKTVAENFFSEEETQLSPHFQPDRRGKTPQELADLVETTSSTPGWDSIGSYMLNRGQFNVNSTSKEAWKALLMSMANRPIPKNDVASGTSVGTQDSKVTLSRYPLANSDEGATGPGDDSAWNGIRKLTDEEINKLAEEIVRQVKERGPFLNMTEFINRRLSSDSKGVTSALQAAIDWDEYNADYNGTLSGSGESINKAYKSGDAMITDSQLPANYPNRKAACGSRYAGIPGYVMQADILQGISTSLSVRGDTFLIRAYGESLTTDGKVAAKAWCEAVVQRMPDYMDTSDAAETKMRTAGQLPSVTPVLKPRNQTFGRKFNIISFRWLNSNEV